MKQKRTQPVSRQLIDSPNCMDCPACRDITSGLNSERGANKEKSNGHLKFVCDCKSCACQNYASKRQPGSENVLPRNAIVFQLPKYREPKSDTYSHTVYMKEMCNRDLMKQHANLAQKRTSHQRTKKTAAVEQKRFIDQQRFICKTTADSDFRKYNQREVAACKAKFPRIRRKEDFYFRPGEYSCDAKFPPQPVSHEDYSPKVPIPSFNKRNKRQCDVPRFEGTSCYDRDFRPPPLEAYSVGRKPRKKVYFE